MSSPSEFDPDPLTLEMIRALVDRLRKEERELDGGTIQRRVLDELYASLPAASFSEHDLEPIVAMWQRAIVQVLTEVR